MRRRGIVLVTSIILTVIMLMFVGAAMSLGPASLGANRTSAVQRQAEMAAQSGIDYCLAQLRLDPAWRGDKNQITVNQSDMVVIESNGNVAGLIATPDGEWTQFRCRFNYQDGAGGLDGFANEPAYTIDHPFVSVNNLQGILPIDVPRADQSGYAVGATSRVAHRIPTWAISLAVEGRAGLRDVDPNTPEVAFGGSARRVVEAVYQVEGSGGLLQEAGSMIGQNFSADLGSSGGTVSVNSLGNATPKLRAKGDVTVTGGASDNYVSPNGEVRSGPGTLAANYDSAQTTVTAEAAVDPYYQLAWSDVHRADPAGPSLQGGTYVWWDDGSLHYYDMSFQDYRTYMQDPANVNDPGVSPPVLPATMQITGTTLKVTGDVHVQTSGNGVDGLAIVPRMGAEEAPPGDPEAGGGGGGGDPIIDLVSSLPAPSYNAGAGRTTWIVPMSGSGNVTIEAGSSWRSANDPGAPADFAMFLTDNGDGTGTLLLRDDNYELCSLSPPIPADPTLALQMLANRPAFQASFGPQYTQLMNLIGSGGGGGVGAPEGAVDPPGVSDSLTPAQLTVEFDNPQGAVLSSDGDIVLQGSVTGAGGSLTSGGEIRVVGAGSSFAGAENPVNMYAVGDIFLSSLVETSPGVYDYNDVTLTGIVYTQGNFNARLSSSSLPGASGTLNIQGLLVAYGGDPSGAPGSNGRGDVDVRAGDVGLVYDPSYLGSLAASPPAGFGVKRLSWNDAP